MRSQFSKSAFLQVKEYTLDNELTIWLNEDHSQPKIFGAVVVKAGARDCPNTGIAHYFEHMMFKGTDKIGTTDYKAEKILLDNIADKYDILAETEDPEQRAQLQMVINDLSVRAAEYVIPNEFDRLISRYGGTKLNAGTSYDYTLYFNTFSPQYIAQWAEINSERLMNPVFRLFQSELETVYEERNMYGDAMASMAIEKITERYFYPHPYAYPIIGSAENLKNPRLSEMRRFFEKYYVASNMGLILSGDFHSEEVMPILASTFGRLRTGNPPRREVVALPPFKGKEKVKVRIPMTFVKILAMGFRGVPANHPDQVALNVAVSLLNNSNGTGFLDKLTVEHKVMGAMAINQSMNEAGILGLLVFPKFLFQSYGAAEKLVWQQIKRVQQGDFSEETFRSLKLEQKREYASKLEDIHSRAEVMMRIFSQGKSWQDYLDEVKRIDALTRADVIAVAKKYFTENYLYVTKETGRYPKLALPKPNYAPIIPKNADASSDYVKQLERIPARETTPHFLDFEQDVYRKQLTPLVTLYVTPNSVNDIFSLTLCHGVGKLERKELAKLAAYLPFVATESMSFEVFRSKLQELGSTLLFDVTDTDFRIMLNGFDSHLTETLTLLGDFMRHAKPDEKKLRQLIDEEKVVEKSLFHSSEHVADMLLEKVMYGDASRYLTKLSLGELKKLKGKQLIQCFQEIRRVACDVHYCGTLPEEEVAEAIRLCLPIEEVQVPSNWFYNRSLRHHERPTIYLMEMKEVTQSVIYAYMYLEPLSGQRDYHLARLFNSYFGGDMSSLMFQEIREFRSYAYEVSARLKHPPLNHVEYPASFVMRLATQADKTVDAMEVLESLVRDMPQRPDRVESVKRTIRNWVNNEYPSSRSLSLKIAKFLHEGYQSDPNKDYVEVIEPMRMEEIMDFYEHHVQGGQLVYAIVGNSKQMDLSRLARFGEIIKVKKKDIYR
ncbi:insulinase family protein [Parabacteroides distasonis]|nr:insulinase family protein [Parabacteroides distasonis]